MGYYNDVFEIDEFMDYLKAEYPSLISRGFTENIVLENSFKFICDRYATSLNLAFDYINQLFEGAGVSEQEILEFTNPEMITDSYYKEISGADINWEMTTRAIDYADMVVYSNGHNDKTPIRIRDFIDTIEFNEHISSLSTEDKLKQYNMFNLNNLLRKNGYSPVIKYVAEEYDKTRNSLNVSNTPKPSKGPKL